MSPAEIPQFDPEKEKAALGLNQQKVEEDSDIENKGEESEEKIDQKETIEITEADFKNEEVLQEKIKNFTPEKYLNFTKKFSGFYK